MLGASKWADPPRIESDPECASPPEFVLPPEEQTAREPELPLTTMDILESPSPMPVDTIASSSPTKLLIPLEDRAPTEERPIRVVKKMLTARGKKISVLMPYDIEKGSTDGLGRPYPLSTEDVEALLDEWTSLGYDVSPFDARNNPENSDGYRSAGDKILTAKTIVTDPDVVISIPDPRGWQRFVNVLNEQKLMELGVAPVVPRGMDSDRIDSPAFTMGPSRFGTPGPSILSIGTPGPSIMSASRLGSPTLSRIGTPGSLALASMETQSHSDRSINGSQPPVHSINRHISKHSMVFPPPLSPHRATAEIGNPMMDFKFPMASQPAAPRLTMGRGNLEEVRERHTTSIQSAVLPNGTMRAADEGSQPSLVGEPGDDSPEILRTPKASAQPDDDTVIGTGVELLSEPGPSRHESIVPTSNRSGPSTLQIPPPESQSSSSDVGRIFSRGTTPPQTANKHLPKLSKSNLNAQAAAFTFTPTKPPFDQSQPERQAPQPATSHLQPGAPPVKPDFDPLATFKPSNFSFLTATAKVFQPKHTPSTSRNVDGVSVTSGYRPTLNVAAPVFQPRMQIPSGEFSFMSSYSTRNPSTSTFGESDHGGAGLSDTMTSVGMSSSEGPRSGKIFGNITDVFKIPKKSKPLSIRPLDSPEVHLGIEAEESQEEDDMGRAQRPQGRGKRLRASRAGVNSGDEVPQFASPREEIPDLLLGEQAAAAAGDPTELHHGEPQISPDVELAEEAITTLPRSDRPSIDRNETSRRVIPQSSQPSSVRRLRRSSSAQSRSHTIHGYPSTSAFNSEPTLTLERSHVEERDESAEGMQAVVDRLASKSFRRKGIPDFDRDTSTPLAQPLYYRSNAPSPSPRKVLDDRFLANVVPSAWKAAQTLRSYPPPPPGVHRLNANEEIPTSDWDDAFPDDREDYKLQRPIMSGSEQRSDRHSSPAPVTRISHIDTALTNIQQSLAALSAQQANVLVGRKSRRATSLDILSSAIGMQSDADDEDDSNDERQATPSWARQRSPRRYRREDRLRFLVREAVEEGMERDTLAELGDMREILASLQLAEIEARQQLSELYASVQEMNEHHAKAMDLMPLNNAVLSPPTQIMLPASDNQLLSELQQKLEASRAELFEARSRAEATKQSLETFRVRLNEEVSSHSDTRLSLNALREQYHEERNMHATTQALHIAAEKQIQANIEHHKEVENRSSETISQLLQQVTEMTKREALQRATVQLKTPALERSRVMVNDLQKALSTSQTELLTERAKARQAMQGHAEMIQGLNSTIGELKRERAESQSRQMGTSLKEASLHAQILALQSQVRDLTENQGSESVQMKVQHQLQLDRLESKYQISLAENDMHLSDLTAERERLTLDLDAERTRSSSLLKNLQADYKTSKQNSIDHAQELLRLQHANEIKHYKASLELEKKGRHEAEALAAQRADLQEQKLAQKDEQLRFQAEQIQISREAAQAAVQNARQVLHGQTIAVPTSVSPNKKQRTVSSAGSNSGGSLRLRPDDSNLPIRISPQALKESILVLQEQLQQRESRIEELEADLVAFSTSVANCPAGQPQSREDFETNEARLETEIAWLRELLEVRLADLQDLVKGLDVESFDREAVGDAAVRLKAGLEMEIQERERAAATLFSPSSASQSTSERLSARLVELGRARTGGSAAPLKQALGNLRRAREEGASYLGMAATAVSDRIGDTPLKSRAGFFGIFTPPSTSQRPSSSSSVRAIAGSSSRRLDTEMYSGAARSRLGSGASTFAVADSVDNSPTKGRGKGRMISISGFDGDAERLNTAALYGRMAAEDGKEDGHGERGGEMEEDGIFGEESFVVDH